MSWHYQIIKHDTGKKFLQYYAIHEVYNKPFGYTEFEIRPLGDTKKELIDGLEMMLKDAKRYPVLSLKKLEEKYK